MWVVYGDDCVGMHTVHHWGTKTKVWAGNVMSTEPGTTINSELYIATIISVKQ